MDVAIVGCGLVANDHRAAWKKIPNAKVVAVCDVNEDLAKTTAHRWRIPAYYTSLADMINEETLNVVDICTPPQTHASLAVQAMQAEINVLIEKPMTMTVEDAEKIVSCQNDTRVKAGVMHNWLYEPPIMKAKSLVKEGRVGEILSAEIEILNTKADTMAASEHHWSHKFPGGRLSELLPHPIYLLRHFLGKEIEHIDVLVTKLGHYPWVRSDELVTVFRNGNKLGRFYVSLNAPRDAIFVTLYGSRGILKSEIVNATTNLYLERQTSRFNKATDTLGQAAQLVGSTLKNAVKISLGRWESGHDLSIRLFAESVERGNDPPVTVQDGYQVVKIVERICGLIEKPGGSA
jgi:predicted dehydrogenase